MAQDIDLGDGITARVVFVNGVVAQAVGHHFALVHQIVHVLDAVAVGIHVSDEPPAAVVFVADGEDAARVLDAQQSMGAVIAEGRRIPRRVGHADQVTGRIVAVVNRSARGVGDLRDPVLGVADEGDALAIGVADAVGRDRQDVAVEIGDRLQPIPLIDHQHPAILQRQLVPVRVIREERVLVNQLNVARIATVGKDRITRERYQARVGPRERAEIRR